ncbi:ABC transporter substrate-binding protein [Paenibacillus terrigena]|uniref:ABC transporter substrate-binding protein n=1 Tax=Paenibacillus terrigena TaxID=369333 RepID=UPI0003601261|nr:extracellular solute-binding protein [Paenibacillus terrigena]
MKKIGSLLLVTTLLVGMTACGGGNNEGSATNPSDAANSSNEPKTQESVQAKFFYDNAAWTDYLKDINPITLKNSQTEMIGVPYNEPTSFQTAVRVGFTTNDAADVFKWWNGFQMKELVDAGYLADMTEQWKEMEKDGVDPSMANTLTFDGKTYGIPAGVHYWVMFYNKKLFNDNGLKAPRTWDEFLAVSDSLKAKGITPIGTTVTDVWNGFIWFEEMMIHSNPDLYNKLVVGQAKYTDPGVVEVMKTWKSLYDKGYFAKPMDWNKEIAPAMAKGQFAMYMMGTWYSDYFKNAGMKPGEDLGTFVLPAIKPEAGNNVISEVTPFLVSQNSKNKDNAIKALVALTKKEANEKVLSLYGGVPIRKDIESKDSVIKELSDTINQGGYKSITRFWEATPSELSEYASSEFVRFMLNPDQYMTVLENIQKKADKYWSEHN